MPFGFDPHEAEEEISKIRDIKHKVYVDVFVICKTDGKMIPQSFIWENGHQYKIDKVLSTKPGHSLKVFSPGYRFRCRTGKRIYDLHFDGERWYIEFTPRIKQF